MTQRSTILAIILKQKCDCKWAWTWQSVKYEKAVILLNLLLNYLYIKKKTNCDPLSTADQAALPYFYGPVAVILLSNLVIFFLTSRAFAKHYDKLKDVTRESFNNFALMLPTFWYNYQIVLIRTQLVTWFANDALTVIHRGILLYLLFCNYGLQ